MKKLQVQNLGIILNYLNWKSSLRDFASPSIERERLGMSDGVLNAELERF